MAFYFAGWIKTPVNAGNKSSIKTHVSILLPVRNEERNIQAILKALSEQLYPKELYEIIVIDDFSSDKTEELALQFQISNMKYIRLHSGGGKKSAITEGIRQAEGELIVTTDADCEMGNKWLREIVSFYEEHSPKMIIGPVMLKNENSLQEKIQSLEMLVLSACGCAAAYFNSPILCSGANLAYQKKTFLDINGYHEFDKTLTGEDMFLMLKIHKKFSRGIQYLKSTEACVYTYPETSIAAAIKQRKRWTSKSLLYGFSYITCIAVLVFFTNLLILISGILSAINIKFVLLFVLCFSAKCIIDFMILRSTAVFFNKKSYPVLFFLSSVVYPIYVCIVGILSPFTNYSWKGRQS